MNKALFAATAALMIGGFVSPVLAAQPAGADQNISIRGVNFNNPANVDGFYVRLAKAAATACDSYAATGRVSVADRLCADRAVAQAVKTLNRPVLTAMHESRSFNQPVRQLAGQDQ